MERLISQINPFSKSSAYKALFMLSMILFATVDCFLLIRDTEQSSQEIGHYASFLQGIKTVLAVSTVVGSILNILNVFFSNMYRKTENCLLELMEWVLIPCQIMFFVIGSKLQSASQPQTPVDDQFLTTSVAICLITNITITCALNFKIQLRYKSSPFLGFTKLSTKFYGLLLFKSSLSAVFNLFLQSEQQAYLVALALITFYINYACFREIQFQSPIVECLMTLTLLFLWTPVLLLGFDMALSVSPWSSFIIHGLCCLAYLILGLARLSYVAPIVSIKYLRLLEEFERLFTHAEFFKSSTKITQRQVIAILAILREVISMKQQRNPSTANNNQQSIQWSYPIIAKCKMMLQGLQCPKGQSQRAHENQGFVEESIDQSSRQLILNDQNQSQADKTKSQSVVSNQEIMWKCIVVPYLQKESKLPSRVFCSYICYAFTDVSNLHKLRLLYSYYLGQKNQKPIFLENIESQITHNCLLERFRLFDIQIEKAHAALKKKQQLDQIKLPINQRDGTQCLKQDSIYINPYYNNIVEEQQIFKQILQAFQTYIRQQQRFLEMLKQQKQKDLIGYLHHKNTRKKQLTAFIEQYRSTLTTDEQKINLVTFEYLKRKFIDKEKLIAERQYQRNLSKIYQFSLGTTKSVIYEEAPLEFCSGSSCRDSLSKAKISKIQCVVSGIQKFGQINACCSSFRVKLLSQRYQKASEGFQYSINQIIPTVWREKHEQIQKREALYQKRVDHVSSRYFVQSVDKSFIAETKFRMFFYVEDSQDLKLVLDFSLVQLSELVIANPNGQKIICKQTQKQIQTLISAFKTGAKINQADDDVTLEDLQNEPIDANQNQTSQEQQMKKIQVFGQDYLLKIEVQEDESALAFQNSPSIFEMQDFQNQKSPQDQKFEQESLTQQCKFWSYKKKFQPWRYEIACLFIIMVTLNSLVIWGYQTLIQSQHSNLEFLVHKVETKLGFGNEYCQQQAFATIEVGIFYNMAKGRITFKNDDQKFQAVRESLYSVIDVKKQAYQRYLQVNIQSQTNTINDQLLVSGWLDGFESSYLMQTLENDRKLVEALNIFSDPTVFTEDLLDYIEDQKPVTLMIDGLQQTDRIDEYEADELQDVADDIPTIVVRLQVPGPELEEIRRFGEHAKHMLDLFYGDQGFIEQTHKLQELVFEESASSRNSSFFFFIIGLVVAQIISLKFSLNLNGKLQKELSHGLNLSQSAQKSMAEDMTQMQDTLSQVMKVPSKSMHSVVSKTFDQLRTSTQVMKETNESGTGFLPTIKGHRSQVSYLVLGSLSNSSVSESEKNESQHSKFRLNLLISMLRFCFTVWFFSASFLAIQSEENKIRTYSRSISELMRLNGEMMELFVELMYPYDDQISLEETEKFRKTMHNVEKYHLMDMINNMFPYNETKGYICLYQSYCDELEDCTDKMDDYYSFMDLTNRMKFSFSSLLTKLQKQHTENYTSTDSQQLSDGYVENYHKIAQLVQMIDDTTELGFNDLKEKIEEHIHSEESLDYLIILTVAEFLFQVLYLLGVVIIYQREFLTFAGYSDLRAEEGFSFHANRSQCQQNTDRTCSHLQSD